MVTTPENTTEVFQVLHQYAAWQTAVDETYERHLVPKPSFIEGRKHSCYVYESFPRILKDVVAENSVVRCNFDLESHWTLDPEHIFQEHREWSADNWQEALPSIDPWKFNTMPPLPPFNEILAENVMPEPVD
ncbi:hypothetical protein K458DRAFT_11047 [Lentithecium fluviatile CBS 122367]|uniref:Uncharacterized protein n=1 Tax=Lentithecium fluviatile CBS 122367 TaxID=1168545 RepID=A0A6G1JNQ0_9PLEO|nr:hypothetical protein K458DRAFT_11047 [Lentithecium fluviatile CBS 122367]